MEVNVVHGTNGFLKKKNLKLAVFLRGGHNADFGFIDLFLLSGTPILSITMKDLI